MYVCICQWQKIWILWLKKAIVWAVRQLANIATENLLWTWKTVGRQTSHQVPCIENWLSQKYYCIDKKKKHFTFGWGFFYSLARNKNNFFFIKLYFWKKKKNVEHFIFLLVKCQSWVVIVLVNTLEQNVTKKSKIYKVGIHIPGIHFK